MSGVRFVTHVAPVAIVLGLVGLLYLVPTVRFTVQGIDGRIEDVCAELGSDQRDACLPALIQVLESERDSFERKNDVVWVIGQLADPTALPHLEKLLTGKPCPDPCRKDRAICQRELRKAIRWCKGEAWLMKSFRSLTGSRW